MGNDMTKEMEYKLTIVVEEEFNESFKGIDTHALEQHIGNCHPEVSYASFYSEEVVRER